MNTHSQPPYTRNTGISSTPPPPFLFASLSSSARFLALRSAIRFASRFETSSPSLCEVEGRTKLAKGSSKIDGPGFKIPGFRSVEVEVEVGAVVVRLDGRKEV